MDPTQTQIAVVGAGPGGYAAAFADDQPKRVGLIGSGWYGKCDLLRLIQVAPVEVVSLCDVDKRMLAEAASQQLRKLPYYHQFGGKANDVAIALAERIVKLMPVPMSKVFFNNSGSEANETAIKMARQYHIHRGKPTKHRIIARWQGFHGITLGMLSVSGRPSWREPFDPYLIDVGHIQPPYCYRCPLGQTYPGCQVACADELERAILLAGPDTVRGDFTAAHLQGDQANVLPTPSSLSMRSATLNIFMSFVSWESLRATSLMTWLRGSAMVYTGWPKPMTTSLFRMRVTMSASAASGVA